MSEIAQEQSGEWQNAGAADAGLQADYDTARLEVISRERLVLGLVAGLVGVFVSALVWAGIAVATGSEIGWIAIGVGFLVGLLVRIGGRGVTIKFGILAAALSLVAILVGKYFSFIGFVMTEGGISLGEAISYVDASVYAEAMKVSFSVIDLLFYGLALWTGLKYGFKNIDVAIAEQQ